MSEAIDALRRTLLKNAVAGAGATLLVATESLASSGPDVAIALAAERTTIWHVVPSLIALVDDEPDVFASTLRENLRLAINPDRAADVSDDRDVVADRDVPRQDLGLGEPFPDVGEAEGLGAHGVPLPDGDQKSRTRSTASRTRSRSGRYSSSIRDGG